MLGYVYVFLPECGTKCLRLYTIMLELFVRLQLPLKEAPAEVYRGPFES
jgi:hypothetical protein